MEKMDRLVIPAKYASGTTSAVVTIALDAVQSYYLSAIMANTDLASNITISDGTNTLFKVLVPTGLTQIQFPHGVRFPLVTNLTITVGGTAACSINVVGSTGY